METLNEEQKFKIARQVGSVYFISLGVVNLGATYIFSVLSPLDLIILVMGYLPILVNRKFFFLIYGLGASIISVLMGLACIANNLNPELTTTQLSFNMGYLLISTMLLSSFLLFYVSLRSSDRKDIVLT